MKKSIYIPVIFILVGIAFIAFNIYASRQASDQINKFVQVNINTPASPVQVNYSSINVPFFSGKINFSNVVVNFKNSKRMVKMDHLRVKLGYFSLFRFYVSKTKKAFKHTNSFNIRIKNLRLINPKNHRKFTASSVRIHQRGNLWDAIQAVYLNIPLSKKQLLEFKASHLRYKKKGAGIGVLKGDFAYFKYVIPGLNSTVSGTQDSLLFRGVTWELPPSLQKQYGIFLAGFGFSSDSVQINRAGFSFSSLSYRRIRIRNGIFKTDPLAISFKGRIIKRTPWTTSIFSPLKLTVVHISDQLKSLLTGFGFIKQTGGQKENQLTFRLTGPISSPKLKK